MLSTGGPVVIDIDLLLGEKDFEFLTRIPWYVFIARGVSATRAW